MTAQSQQLVATVLPPQLQGAATELGLYLSDSLGELRKQQSGPLSCASASIRATSVCTYTRK